MTENEAKGCILNDTFLEGSSGVDSHWSCGSGDINWELRAMWKNCLKKKIKSKKQLVALPRQTLGNKGDLVALKHDCSSEQRKIGMLSM